MDSKKHTAGLLTTQLHFARNEPMNNFRSTLIVVPAFNEEDSVGKVVKKIFKELPEVKCLVVDDGSTDNTSSVASDSGAIVASLPYNLGVGGAMRVGFNFARANGFSNVVQVDADGQHRPSEIKQLLAKLEQADLVLGSRFSGVGQYETRGPRKWAMTFLAFTLSKSAKTKLTDTTSGFRASGPRAIDLFSKHYPAEYLGDTVESLVIAARAGLKIVECPVQMDKRTTGTPSHKPIKASIFLVRVVVAIIFASLRPPVQSVEQK